MMGERRLPVAEQSKKMSNPRTPYLPIADYGVIGDARSIALVSTSGSIDWWCLPHFDGDAIFGRLLDANLGGYFSIEPVGDYETRRAYVEDTNILTTEFTTETGSIKIVDFMPALTELQKETFPIPDREIVRRIIGISGNIRLQVRVKVRPDYGRRAPKIRKQHDGIYMIAWGGFALLLVSSIPFTIEPDGILSATVEVANGDRIDLALAYSFEAPAELPTLGSLDLVQQLTQRFWETWSRICGYRGPYRAAVVRSALALKLLTYAPSGAIVAAATTSLPEVIGGVRNWDYRYCWMRDSAFTIRALLELGYTREAHAFSHWLLYATRLTHPEVHSLYTVYGQSKAKERDLEFLEGYRGSRPVRIGNAAINQFQLDVYGEVIDALTLYHRSGGDFDVDARRMIKGLVNVILKRWQEPDDGIWEVRSGRAQHVHSKVMAFVGLERALELVKNNGLKLDAANLAETRDAIRSWVLAHGFDERIGSFTRTPQGDLDAALLVTPMVSFLDARDGRLTGTVDAIQRHLSQNELVFRYQGKDGLPGDEGAFVLCSFWMIEALARIGRVDEAHELFQAMLDRRNDLGLLAEEIDPTDGKQLGNFPQAFSHIGLINAALTLANADTVQAPF
ncbi:MAG TPA: glycoside hydrolase family 15 protein [Nitrolancea sp.]|nr:glycoside hydrolase family 15 protein [Nitrolancea sp.]